MLRVQKEEMFKKWACAILPTRDHGHRYVHLLAFPHLESPHPAGERRPTPEGSQAGSAVAAGSAGSVPRPAGAPWLQRGDGLVDHSLSRCPGGAATFGPTPTPQSVASGAPVLWTSLQEPIWEMVIFFGYRGKKKKLSIFKMKLCIIPPEHLLKTLTTLH